MILIELESRFVIQQGVCLSVELGIDAISSLGCFA